MKSPFSIGPPSALTSVGGSGGWDSRPRRPTFLWRCRRLHRLCTRVRLQAVHRHRLLSVPHMQPEHLLSSVQHRIRPSVKRQVATSPDAHVVPCVCRWETGMGRQQGPRRNAMGVIPPSVRLCKTAEVAAAAWQWATAPATPAGPKRLRCPPLVPLSWPAGPDHHYWDSDIAGYLYSTNPQLSELNWLQYIFWGFLPHLAIPRISYPTRWLIY